MRRSIEEVKTELQLRSAEYEKRKRARIKRLTIGAGAALALILVAIPVIKGAMKLSDASAPETASVQMNGAPPTAFNTGGAPQSGSAENYKPPRDGDGKTTDGAPSNSEPTAMPGDANPPDYGNYGEDMQAPGPELDPKSGIVGWYDGMSGEFFTCPRDELTPQYASVVAVDEEGKHRHEIWDEADTARITAALFTLLDNSEASEEPFLGATDYNIRLYKDDCYIHVTMNDDCTFWVGNAKCRADKAYIRAFYSVLEEVRQKHTEQEQD
ncbi:MAG: hypothetical protein IKZ82_13065 [Clostridia bacterium]|nr:hypothetical protein [Clostridia bacterium]